MKQTLKQYLVTASMTVGLVALFALAPLATITHAQIPTPTSTSTTTTTGGDQVKAGLDSIAGSFPDTVVAKDSTPSSLAKRIIDIALYVSALLAVIFIIYGGYQYIFSGGNDETAKTGRKTLTNALIGLSLVVLSYIIVQVVYRFLTNQI